MSYTLEELKNENVSFPHGLCAKDVEIANRCVDAIEQSRKSYPMAGDRIQYTTRHGDYYRSAFIEKIDGEKANVCMQSYSPFTFVYEDQQVRFSASGGPWESVAAKELKPVGQDLGIFSAWSSTGARAHGAIDFKAKVNIWTYSEPDPLYGEYTTRLWRRWYVDYREEPIGCGPYHYLTDGMAWKDELSYKSWLQTYHGVEFAGYWPNQTVVFCYRKHECLINQTDWEKLPYEHDTRMLNGSIIPIKFCYDHEHKIISEYRYTNREDRPWWGNFPYILQRNKILN